MLSCALVPTSGSIYAQSHFTIVFTKISFLIISNLAKLVSNILAVFLLEIKKCLYIAEQKQNPEIKQLNSKIYDQ